MLLFATQSSIRSQPPTSFSPTRVPLSVSEPTSVPPLGLTYEAGLEKHFGAKEPLLAKLDLSAVRQQAFLCVGRCGGFHSLLVKVQSHVAVFLFQVPDRLLVPWGQGTGPGGSGKGQEMGAPTHVPPQGASARKLSHLRGEEEHRCSCSCLLLLTCKLCWGQVCGGEGRTERLQGDASVCKTSTFECRG